MQGPQRRQRQQRQPSRLLAALIFPFIAAAAPPPGAPPQIPACAACHGTAALGNRRKEYPALAGQSARYLFWQLMDFKRGTRRSPVMQPIARRLSKPEMTALAHDFAALPVPVSPEPATLPEGLGRELAVRGSTHQSSVATPACDFCHGANGTGAGPFPRLAGEPAAYLADQLRAWQQDTRPAGPLGLMGHVATGLSAREIQAVAAYYAVLAPHPPVNETHGKWAGSP